MCIALFIAVEQPIAERPWDRRSPAPFIARLADSSEPPRPYFHKPHVYTVGDEEGCACGFAVPGVGLWDPDDDWERRKLEQSVRSITAYREFVGLAVAADPHLELYVGDVDDYAAPGGTRYVALDDILPPEHSLEGYVDASRIHEGEAYLDPWDIERWKGSLLVVGDEANH